MTIKDIFVLRIGDIIDHIQTLKICLLLQLCDKQGTKWPVKIYYDELLE